MSTRIPAGIVLALFLSATTGCGQKGPLTIPPPPAGQEQPEAAENENDSEEATNE